MSLILDERFGDFSSINWQLSADSCGPLCKQGPAYTWAGLEVLCSMPRRLKVVIAHHEKVIADTLATILQQSNADATAAYSNVSGLEVVLSTNPDLAILCIVPAYLGDLNGVYAAVVLRALLPACSILLCAGGSGTWVDEPLARAKARGYEFGLLPEPIHPEKLFELVTELPGGYVEPIRKLSVPSGG